MLLSLYDDADNSIWYAGLRGKQWVEVLDQNANLLAAITKNKVRSKFQPKPSDPGMGRSLRLVLTHHKGEAVMIFRPGKLPSGETGMKCVLFFNNSSTPDSTLVIDSGRLAEFRAKANVFAVLNPDVIRIKDALKSFLQAGWVQIGKSPDGYPIVQFRQFEQNFDQWVKNYENLYYY